MDLTLAHQRYVTFFTHHGWGAPVHRDELLIESLTHKSYAADYIQQSIPHNERLEFLGDAILGAAVASLLREDYPDEDEALLTLKKIYLVKEPTLAKAAQTVGLGDRLRFGKGEERSGGRTKDAILSDACEAMIAYMRESFGREVVLMFVKMYIYPYREDSEAVRGKSYKSLLQERVQKTYQQLPIYEEIPEEVESSGNVLIYRSRVRVADELLSEALGSNKKKAQEEAARIAYEKVISEVVNH